MARIENGFVYFKEETESPKEYNLIKVGRPQAQQVIDLARWLSKYGSRIFNEVQSDTGQIKVSELVTKFGAILDVDALIEGFIMVTGCTEEEANLEFDIGVFVEAVLEIIENNQSFRKVIERFFSESES
jgi:hypothetical protein